MLAKIKSGVIGFMVLGVALAGYLWFFDSGKNPVNRDYEMVVLRAAWIPISRIHPISITILVTGEPPAYDTDQQSPWVTTVPVPKGSVVTFTATQPVTDLKLECSVTVKGQTHGPTPAKPIMGGASSCSVTVTA